MTNSISSESVIRVLPPEVTNKIAAGEVIQRPASVVKELLDNAIDAGANDIEIIVQNAGRTLIQVRDNGCGMSEADLPLCFLRHATSKLQTADDLADVRTLGFRGEAMASIAAISQVTVTTKRVEDQAGLEFEVRGGEQVRLEPAPADNGTTVKVRNLFYNVPARRAFLKTDATEFRHILFAVYQAAIAYPDIAFHLISDSETVYKLPASDSLSRISDLFGSSYRASMIPVRETTSLVRITGFLSDPKLAKKTRGEQFLFINKRPFMHRHLVYVIQDIYKDWLQTGSYPFFALFYETDPGMVDVNVHPSKQEIKFEDERSISAFTRSVVKKTLSEYMRVPLWDSTKTGKEFPDRSHGPYGRHFFEKGFGPSHENIAAKMYDTSPHPDPFSGFKLQKPDDPDKTKKPSLQLYPADYQRNNESDLQEGGSFWQIHRQFIVSRTRTGFFILDQHAAHKRIIYDKVLNEAESGLPSTQQLLFPKNIHLSASDFSLLKEIHPLITRMGFNIQMLSGNSAMILGVPSDIQLDDEGTVLESIMEQYKQMSPSLDLERKQRVALALASKAAIPAGRKLNEDEMESLVDQLFACSDPFRDPLGNPTIRSLSVDDIRKLLFKQM